MDQWLELALLTWQNKLAMNGGSAGTCTASWWVDWRQVWRVIRNQWVRKPCPQYTHIERGGGNTRETGKKQGDTRKTWSHCIISLTHIFKFRPQTSFTRETCPGQQHIKFKIGQHDIMLTNKTKRKTREQTKWAIPHKNKWQCYM